MLVGAVDEAAERRVRDAVPDAEAFISGLDWLAGTDGHDGPDIGRLLLVDRSAILLSSVQAGTEGEHAIFGTGSGNGLVVIARRVMSHGLLTARDPGRDGQD